MNSILEFVRKVFLRFVNVITGSIVALYYIFIAPIISDQPYKPTLDIVVPIIALFLAFYLAWKDAIIENQKLLNTIKEHEDKKPNYSFKVVDARNILRNNIKNIDLLIDEAIKEETKAPDTRPNPYMIRPIITEPSKSQWSSYIENLKRYKQYLNNIADTKDAEVINIILTNKGTSDNNIHVTLDFHGTKQVVDFYEDEIVSKIPQKPFNIMNIQIANTSIQKLGIKREVHHSKESQIDIEIEMLRSGDSINLHDCPIFMVKKSGKIEIDYELHSTLCKPIKGKIDHNLWPINKDHNESLATNLNDKQG